MAGSVTVDQVVAELRKFRIPCSNEASMQRAIDLILKRISNGVAREYVIHGGHGRIDFYLPIERIGIEAKVQGSAADTTRQLFRYAESGFFSALILVTNTPMHTALPADMAGVPITVVLTARGL